MLFYSYSYSHVTLEYPNGGETFQQGQFIKIRWNVNIDHFIENWDIWYSTTGSQGPWIEIVIDHPKGDTTQFSVHEFLWTIPNVATNDFRIRIQQDNPLTDWDAISFSANSVVDSDCCILTRGNMLEADSGYPMISDLVALVDWFFRNGNPPFCAYESNIDGSADGLSDISDLVYLVNYLYQSGPLPVVCP